MNCSSSTTTTTTTTLLLLFEVFYHLVAILHSSNLPRAGVGEGASRWPSRWRGCKTENDFSIKRNPTGRLCASRIRDMQCAASLLRGEAKALNSSKQLCSRTWTAAMPMRYGPEKTTRVGFMEFILPFSSLIPSKARLESIAMIYSTRPRPDRNS